MTSRVNGNAAPATRQSTTGAQRDPRVDLNHVERSTLVDQNLELLRSCVHDLHYTLDALEAHMGIGRAYIGKVLNGEKPLRLEFEVTLPDDLKVEYRKRQAESFGLIVVRPLTGMDAQRAFVAGALGLLSTGLPSRASAMAKADLSVVKKTAVNE